MSSSLFFPSSSAHPFQSLPIIMVHPNGSPYENGSPFPYWTTFPPPRGDYQCGAVSSFRRSSFHSSSPSVARLHPLYLRLSLHWRTHFTVQSMEGKTSHLPGKSYSSLCPHHIIHKRNLWYDRRYHHFIPLLCLELGITLFWPSQQPFLIRWGRQGEW